MNFIWQAADPTEMRMAVCFILTVRRTQGKESEWKK